MLFRDPLHEELTWLLAYAPYGGADFGEVRAVAQAVGDGDDAAFHAAWVAAGDRLQAEADAQLAKGHAQSARESLLRATAFYGSAYRPLFGAPVDARLVATFRRQVAAFDRALALGAHPVAPLRIPFGKLGLPAYLIPAEGREREVRPLIIFNDGYDGTVTDTYFASAVAASQRGYHALLFDGPGQGEMLFEHGVPLRPDWETVVGAVVDFALTQPTVDAGRIALSGWSLGGHLAPRAAAAEPRLAALVADPGTWSIAAGFRDALVRRLGMSAEAASDLGSLEQPVIERLKRFIAGDRLLHWKVMRRGFWVHGVDNLRDYLASAELFTLEGRAELIRCPTLVTMAENDALAAYAPRLFEALRCPKALMRFTASEGADGHCEMRNRSLLNRRVLDWLDEQLGGA